MFNQIIVFGICLCNSQTVKPEALKNVIFELVLRRFECFYFAKCLQNANECWTDKSKLNRQQKAPEDFVVAWDYLPINKNLLGAKRKYNLDMFSLPLCASLFGLKVVQHYFEWKIPRIELFFSGEIAARRLSSNKCAAHFLWLVILLIYSASGRCVAGTFLFLGLVLVHPETFRYAINSLKNICTTSSASSDEKTGKENDNLFIDW